MHYVREYVQDLSWYAMFNMTKVKLELISYADIYSLKKVWQAELITVLRGLVKPIIIVLNLMTQSSNQKTLCT